MTIKTTTHLNFRGEAQAALEFYQSVFGGQIALVTYAQLGAVEQPGQEQQIIWGQVESPEGFHIMAYDVRPSQDYAAGVNPVFVSVRGETADEIQGYWDRLADGAAVIQPIGPSGWSPLYGMLKDRFGVTWVIDVAVAHGG
ncbi:MAG: VOC family protein [Candidatus Devosia phytovorans]|uniref:VOC family protein n=1 Tax=Candidatus Devosia phytovorans TaxID=3121372 RepID=A0AAJ5VX16_9HYPH|nr:VOC family protein [Devosia sp.]WEK04969.1 MAG: VOC family protein [Devosia sp.]